MLKRITLLILILSVLLFLVLVFVRFTTLSGPILLSPLLLIALFLRFTLVKEGTAKAVVRLRAFKKAVMSWQGYRLDKDWEVEPGSAPHLPGGLRFVGIWPLDKIYTYNLRWRDIQLVKGEERAEFHEERIDYTLVRPDVYLTDTKGAETKPPERIPLDLQFLVTIRVSNPFKALFRAPSNWNENVMTRLNALFRSWVGTKLLDEILEIKQKPQQLWKEFKDEPLIREIFRGEWGITIEENGIEIRVVGLPEEYQKAAAAQKRQALEAAGRAAETVGTVIEMMAQSRGKEVSEIKEEINRSSELRKEFLDMAKDLIVRKLAIEGKSYLDIRVQGAEGMERTLLNALAVWKRMPGAGGKIQEEEAVRKGPSGGETPFDRVRAEAKAEALKRRQ